MFFFSNNQCQNFARARPLFKGAKSNIENSTDDFSEDITGNLYKPRLRDPILNGDFRQRCPNIYFWSSNPEKSHHCAETRPMAYCM